ncbi:tetrahydrofolate dehydrogenase/cyclohydrolase catalytic domain-containing protein [Lactobacillus sp. ESL0791]|uniref:bifunctional 5,10-methylenetetrahydrofolate dehydrogenase/5,10-methenyltetrahydrofolate cyclohydrolase n=1 Tax=Lactobacillus sp. ESL0791 TaxID=2983234 RepID=UPI0023F831F9|nr:tetrahydrofolate dehydrogenase/cyclohydrolase catalytic domain-containing protein [Lactobacillus sp. ESL0791]MDF7638706.1 tetrahydrofolate dehydrogenase/cyclohydrolase catalytic domain-containing protein [Lactobacillus sp. ESL0791]
MGKILDGQGLADLRAARLKKEVQILKNQGQVPLFCVINIGADPASRVYIKSKKKRADEVGIKQKIYQLPVDETQADLLTLIDRLNFAKQVSGIILQLPVPRQIDAAKALARIDPEKDVDCLTPSNVGRLWQGRHFVEPATASGIIALLDYYKIKLAGRNAVIVGRSNIVGKPLAAMLLERDATVSLLHSKTQDLAAHTQEADILVSAVGRPNLITANMVKPGAAVIDVGINRTASGQLVGDVAFAEVREKAGYLTPVPGGVGPLTVESLMEQVVKLTRRQNGR